MKLYTLYQIIYIIYIIVAYERYCITDYIINDIIIYILPIYVKPPVGAPNNKYPRDIRFVWRVPSRTGVLTIFPMKYFVEVNKFLSFGDLRQTRISRGEISWTNLPAPTMDS